MFSIECSLIKCSLVQLTLSWRRPLSYRNQSIDFLCKSIEWFLYDNGLRHERVKEIHRLWKEINSLLSKEMPNSKKISSSVRLPQILLNIWTSCCNLKTRRLGAILCVVFVLFLFWKELFCQTKNLTELKMENFTHNFRDKPCGSARKRMTN